MSGRTWSPILAAALLCFLSASAQAHRVSLFAAVQAGAIEGECYFSGGGRPANAVVRILGPNGETLGEVKTDAEGRFRYKPTLAADHTFVLDPGDGHRAEFTVTAAELTGLNPTPNSGATAMPQPTDTEPVMKAASLPDAALEQRIAEAVAREIRPLRRQLEEAQNRARLRDILGGIGYIVGVMGLVFFLKGRRRPDAGR